MPDQRKIPNLSGKPVHPMGRRRLFYSRGDSRIPELGKMGYHIFSYIVINQKFINSASDLGFSFLRTRTMKNFLCSSLGPMAILSGARFFGNTPSHFHFEGMPLVSLIHRAIGRSCIFQTQKQS